MRVIVVGGGVVASALKDGTCGDCRGGPLVSSARRPPTQTTEVLIVLFSLAMGSRPQRSCRSARNESACQSGFSDSLSTAIGYVILQHVVNQATGG